ncbi:hypothetical protein G6L37_06535 [Agrobacterium rubi]|nr:hypothetical protein [Agrobacterium rubi]NTF25020.1 hypothetical protein [Agrobacterium rubi]
MAAAEKISYEDRFGDQIRGNVAAVRAAIASGKAPPDAAPVQSAQSEAQKGKHTDWFTDGKGYGDAPRPSAQPKSRLRPLSPGMALKELASATLNNMGVMGEETFDQIERQMRKMVPKHRMERSIKASILNDKPHFGSCRIGKVPFKKDESGADVIVTELQYYIANFDTVIDTSDPARIHTPKSNNFGRTFFGVVVDINQTTGKAIGFNKNYGNEGLVFQTSVPKEALMFMTAFSSGKKPQEIAEMMDAGTRQVAAPSPGMRR